ncbi:MAG: hypothetical protein ACHQ6V_20040 [Myxococcota bacterium]|jgi:hypothetical protein
MRFCAKWAAACAALLLAASLGGCATTGLESASSDPSATPASFAFSKVVVIAMARDESARRGAERALDRVLSAGPRGRAGKLSVDPSYVALSGDDLSNVPATKAKLVAAGYDGVVMLAYSSTEHYVNVQPAGFWGDYAYTSGSMMYDPGAAATETILRIQVRIYSLAEDKMLWSGVSQSSSPSRIDDLVADVAAAVAKDLDRRGLRP